MTFKISRFLGIYHKTVDYFLVIDFKICYTCRMFDCNFYQKYSELQKVIALMLLSNAEWVSSRYTPWTWYCSVFALDSAYSLLHYNKMIVAYRSTQPFKDKAYMTKWELHFIISLIGFAGYCAFIKSVGYVCFCLLI